MKDAPRWHFYEDQDGCVGIVLDTPITFEIDGHELTIPKGYISDGMSCPRWCWPIISPQYDPKTLVPSIKHDFLYDTKVVSRERADEFYREDLVAHGVGTVKAWVIYESVRIGGFSHW